MEFCQVTADKIIGLLATGLYTPIEACEEVGISSEQYHRWCSERGGFHVPAQKAIKNGEKIFRMAAKAGLLELLQGKEHQEEVCTYTVDENGQSRLISRQVTTRTTAPDPAAVILALKAFDPETFQEMQRQTVWLNDARKDKVVRNITFTARGTVQRDQDQEGK